MFAAITRLFKTMLNGRRRAEPKRKRVILELQGLEPRDGPAVYDWTGAVSSSWSYAGNWSVAGHTATAAPGPSDDVVFDNRYGSADCTYNSPMYPQVNSVSLDANYTGTLHLDTYLTAGTLNLYGGAIDQPNGQYSTLGLTNFTWVAGLLNATSGVLANVNLSNGGAFNLRLTQNETTGDNINLRNNNNGVVDSPGFTLDFMNNAGVNINSGCTLNLVDGAFTTGGTGVISNAGTLEKSAGTAAFSTALPIVNSGAFQLLNGALSIGGTDAKGGFDQTGGSTDLSASVRLNVSHGYYMSGGNFWTEGASGSTSTIGGDVDFEGGFISLLHGTGTGNLSVTGNLKIQGSAEYDAKIDSMNVSADKITATGTVTLGGNSTLKTVSINLVGGSVAANQTWTIISSGAANINGDFLIFMLDFGDGSGGKYTAKPSGKDYQVKS